MRIRSLEISNFGVFRGSHKFELSPNGAPGRKRPVVLFGGKNGCGKTTILEAVQLCLYGSHALRLFQRTEPYEEYLNSRIHRSPSLLVAPQGACVTLEFDFARDGKLEQYKVQREWKRTNGKAKESLIVYRDDKLIDEFDHENWLDFVWDLLPPGLSSLFFFDGEKIQRLVNDTTANSEARQAIESLLGVDLLYRLEADLAIYETRILKSTGHDDLSEPIVKVQTERIQLEEKGKALSEELDPANMALNELKAQIDIANQEAISHGGAFIETKAFLEAERDGLKEKTQILEQEIRELCSGLLPAALVPELCASLERDLHHETELQQWEAAKRILSRTLDEVQESVRRGEIDGIPPNDGTVSLALGYLSKKLARFANSEGERPIHNLSLRDSLKIMGWLQEIREKVPGECRRLYSELEKAHRSLQKAMQRANRAPIEEALMPRLQRLSSLTEERVKLEGDIKRIKSEVESINHRIIECSKEIEGLNTQLQNRKGVDRRLLLSSKVSGILGKFATRILEMRLRKLGDEICTRFNQLGRKKSLMESVQIDPKTLEIRLTRKGGQALSREELSAGEKEIFAISLLWGLAHVSGRTLPVIVDTPLARLDSDHRTNLVTKYFPHASHQVVLLSTDTEIDKQFFEELAPAICKAYILHFDDVEGYTSVNEGYFWKEPKEEFVDAGQ